MKEATLIFGLLASLVFFGCKDKPTASEIRVISPQEVHEAVFDNQKQLIDVRTPEEFGEGHIQNAQNICVTDADFRENISKLDKNQPVYLYCRSGKRSAKASQILKEMGFKEIYDMQGGFLEWQSQGLQSEVSTEQ